MSAEIVQWVDPGGAITTLDVDWEASGRFMPDVQHQDIIVPGKPGGVHLLARHQNHEFTLTLTLATADEPSLRQAQRNLVYAMDPSRGEGIIRVTSTIGDVREIPCYYVSGLGMDESPGNSGPNMQQAKVTFRAYDPYWRDVSDTSASFDVGAVPTFFPIFPLRLTSSQIAVDATVLNDGDVQTWPWFTIQGPGSSITLQNITTGKFITFNTLSLTSGQSVVVDTRPGAKTVTLTTANDTFYDLSDFSSLWPLVVGNNAVRLTMSGAITGASKLTMNFRKKYLSP